MTDMDTYDLATSIPVTGPPLGGTIGSSFSNEQLFSGYDSGRVFVYDTPDIKSFKEMLGTDGTSASIEKLLSFPIIACPWEIAPTKGDSGEAEFIAEMFSATEFNEGMLTPIENVIAQLTWAMTVRRVYFEKEFTIRESDGKIVYKGIHWRPPETCELALDARTGQRVGFRQEPVYFASPASPRLPGKEGWKYIPPDRAFVYVYGAWRDPVDGISSMSVPFWVWQTKRKIRYLWYQYLETTSLPKTISRHPNEAKAVDNARKLATLRSRDVIGLDNESQVDAYESSGKGADQFVEALRWLDGEAMKSALLGFMELSSSAAAGKGSYALSHDLSSMFLRSERVTSRSMAQEITNQIIGDVIRYNFGYKAACPRFVFGPLDEASEENVIQLFGQITQISNGTQLPKEFLDELTLRVASTLELDTEKIQKSIEEIKKTSPNPLTEMVATVDLMTTMTQEAKADENGDSKKESSNNGSI